MTVLDILCLGEPLVEFNHIGGGSWHEDVGGDVSNVAIAASRQGAKSGVAARIGGDGFGDLIMKRWEEEKVNTKAVICDKNSPTGLNFVRHNSDGHTFEYRRTGSAASQLSPENLPLNEIRSASILHTSGITQAISQSSCEAVFKAIEEARSAGNRVSYDTNLRLKLWSLDQARDIIHKAMRNIDIALPSLEDARLLTGLHEPEKIVTFYRDLGAKIVALTMGGDGVLISFNGHMELIPSYPVKKVVDATGAGDCFDGAFLSQLLLTNDPIAAGRYATIASGLAVEDFGAITPIPTRRQVEAANSEYVIK